MPATLSKRATALSGRLTCGRLAWQLLTLQIQTRADGISLSSTRLSIWALILLRLTSASAFRRTVCILTAQTHRKCTITTLIFIISAFLNFWKGGAARAKPVFLHARQRRVRKSFRFIGAATASLHLRLWLKRSAVGFLWACAASVSGATI